MSRSTKEFANNLSLGMMHDRGNKAYPTYICCIYRDVPYGSSSLGSACLLTFWHVWAIPTYRIYRLSLLQAGGYTACSLQHPVLVHNVVQVINEWFNDFISNLSNEIVNLVIVLVDI